MVQPILVRRRGDRYQIIAGERRHRAAQALGLATVPVVVREVPDDRLLELALVENIQRAELTPLEEAHAYERLQRELGLTQEEIAKRVGKERPTIANVAAPPSAAPGSPRAPGRRPARRRPRPGPPRPRAGRGPGRPGPRGGAQGPLGARGRAPGGSPSSAPGKKETRRDPNTRAAEERLRAALGARVEIRRTGRKGVLRIPFASEAELQRLFDLLVRPSRGR